MDVYLFIVFFFTASVLSIDILSWIPPPPHEAAFFFFSFILVGECFALPPFCLEWTIFATS